MFFALQTTLPLWCWEPSNLVISNNTWQAWSRLDVGLTKQMPSETVTGQIFLPCPTLRTVSAPDWCFPDQKISEKHVFDELDFHWFSVDQWVFEANGPYTRVPQIELSLISIESYQSLSPPRERSFDSVTDRQIEKQTNTLIWLCKTLLLVEGIKSPCLILSSSNWTNLQKSAAKKEKPGEILENETKPVDKRWDAFGSLFIDGNFPAGEIRH